jgi:acyl-CoA synthetase (AMP-forming)/AMP-acid ligase II
MRRPGVEIEIRDADGKPVRPGVRGEQVSGEYLGKGSRVGADGFFPTRDGGWIDDEGYVFLEGRADDIIVRGGENMSPGEIEDVLIEHPLRRGLRGGRRARRAVGRSGGRRDRRQARDPGERGRAARVREAAAALVARAPVRRVPRRAALQRREAFASICILGNFWRAGRDSNPRPSGSKSDPGSARNPRRSKG